MFCCVGHPRAARRHVGTGKAWALGAPRARKVRAQRMMRWRICRQCSPSRGRICSRREPARRHRPRRDEDPGGRRRRRRTRSSARPAGRRRPRAGRQDVADAIAEAMREAAAAARASRPPTLERRRRRLPGRRSTRTPATVTSARNLPGWEGAFPLGRRAAGARSARRSRLGNDVNVATDAEVAARRGPRRTARCSACSGAPASAAGSSSTASSGRPRRGAAEIGHVVVSSAARRCPCGRRGCMEAYAGRGAMEAPRAQAARARARRPTCFKIMEKRGARG